MNKTKINWADYTMNPVVGCFRYDPYSYCKVMARRFGKKSMPASIKNAGKKSLRPGRRH